MHPIIRLVLFPAQIPIVNDGFPIPPAVLAYASEEYACVPRSPPFWQLCRYYGYTLHISRDIIAHYHKPYRVHEFHNITKIRYSKSCRGWEKVASVYANATTTTTVNKTT